MSAAEPFVVSIEPVLHCSEDDVLACIMLGRQDIRDTDDTWIRRVKVQVDDVYAVLLDRCSSGDDDACFEAAWLGIEGHTTANVRYLAYELMESACTRGHEHACIVLSAGRSRHDADADADAMRLCGEGHTYSCLRLADRTISEWGDAGWRGAADLTTLVLACDQGFAPMCNWMGYLLETHPTTGEPDHDAVLSYYGRACEQGDPGGCWRAASLLDDLAGDDPQPAEAVNFLERGCRMGDGRSCEEAGTAYRSGTGVDADTATALAFYEAACDLGSALGCTNLGRLLQNAEGSAGDAHAALDAWDRACAQGFGLACSDAAWETQDHDDGATPGEQVAIHANACTTSDDVVPCRRLEWVLANREVTGEHAKTGLVALAYACSDRDTRACATGYIIATARARDNLVLAAIPFVEFRGINGGGLVRALFRKTLTRWATESDAQRRDETAAHIVRNCLDDARGISCELLRWYVIEYANVDPPPCDDRPAWLTLIDEYCAARSVGAICIIDATQLTCPAP